MMKRRSLALAVVLAASFTGCGGGSLQPDPLPTPTPTPVPPPRVVSEGSAALGAGGIGHVAFTASLAGRVDITVNWTFDEDNLDVFVMKGSCSFEQLVADTCEHADFSVSPTAKPERVSFAATPGTYTLFVGNRGPKDESLSWQVVLTPSATSTAASTGLGR